jgi:tryptophan 5-monooxygenase
MSASGKSLLGLWLYRSGEQEWAIKRGSPIHKPEEITVNF